MKESIKIFFAITSIITLLTIVSSCFNSKEVPAQNQQTNLAKVSTDYAKYNLNKSNIPEKWEDGMRTTGEAGTYEWWYFDAHLDDGTTAVITFYTKFMTEIDKGLEPYVSFIISKNNEQIFFKKLICEPEDFFASKDSCHVKIGKNYVIGNLKTFEIHLEDEDFNFSGTVTRTTDSWRPQTGHMVFGSEESKEFNWVVSVPKGEIDVSYSYDNKEINTSGSCYHDHNWGNISMMELFNHWYWARAEIGPYNLIASEMISEKEFDNDNIIVFNISKDGKTIADNGEQVRLYRTNGKMHPTLNKDISDDLIFIYDDPQDEYRYEYYLFRENSIVEVDLMAASIGEGLKYKMAKLITGLDPAYFRFTGKAEIRVYKGGELVDKHTSSKAVWELMYFGKPYGIGD